MTHNEDLHQAILNTRPILETVRRQLILRRSAGGMWRGSLSSSAVSTAIATYALHVIDNVRYRAAIEAGSAWLIDTMAPDGTWGDSVESPSNMTATLLSYTTLTALGLAPQASREYFERALGGSDDHHVIDGALRYYGSDMTVSIPVLCMCALSGVIRSWDSIPPFPFELAMLPQRISRLLHIPVVSYAMPMLIAAGILQLRRRHGTRHPASLMREPLVRGTLKRLTALQPQGGGFLETATITGFVVMCLASAGYCGHIVTQRAAGFLTRTQRSDGSWPVDTDLAGWSTSMAVIAMGEELQDKDMMSATIRRNATRWRHSINGAAAGGWGWNELPGSVPDGADTAAALIALHTLGATCGRTVCAGVRWLIDLQNGNGGMPTFSKGWGRLPFDRSSPDTSAHAALAIGLWLPKLPHPLREKASKCIERLLTWLEQEQKDGRWMPLWFGDQDTQDGKAPVYGTATLMHCLNRLGTTQSMKIARRGLDYILESQNQDGGWGGAKGVKSKVAFTAKAITALRFYSDEASRAAIERGVEFLYRRHENGTLLGRDPIGLYFARLWYSEEMHPPVLPVDRAQGTGKGTGCLGSTTRAKNTNVRIF